MIRIVRILSVVLIFALSGCGSTARVEIPVESAAQKKVYGMKLELQLVTAKQGVQVPDHVLNVVKGHLQAELNKRGMLEQDGRDANHLDVQISYYRLRSDSSRFLLGAFAGKDGINGTVVVSEAGTHLELMTLEATSYNVTVFGDENMIARLFAEEVARQLEMRFRGKQS